MYIHDNLSFETFYFQPYSFKIKKKEIVASEITEHLIKNVYTEIISNGDICHWF